jgi:hypothetical protein
MMSLLQYLLQQEPGPRAEEIVIGCAIDHLYHWSPLPLIYSPVDKLMFHFNVAIICCSKNRGSPRKQRWKHVPVNQLCHWSLCCWSAVIYLLQQEPGTPEEIMNALKFVRPGGGFAPNFPLFAKSDINGENRLPLYAWATVNPSTFHVNIANTLLMRTSLW